MSTRSKAALPERILRRLEESVDRSAGPDGCWPWTDPRDRIYVNGKAEEYTRLILFVARGIWAPRWPGIWRCCGTPRCCNPKHLAADRVERFWGYVDKAGPVPAHRPELGPCWVWTGVLTKNGQYGEISVGVYKSPMRAHRFAWELEHGPITDPTLYVCHHCDNPKCVRHEHLFLGTPTENTHDMIRKGRHPTVGRPGSKQPRRSAHA